MRSSFAIALGIVLTLALIGVIGAITLPASKPPFHAHPHRSQDAWQKVCFNQPSLKLWGECERQSLRDGMNNTKG